MLHRTIPRECAWPTSIEPSTARSRFRARSPTCCSAPQGRARPLRRARAPRAGRPGRARAIPKTPLEAWRQWLHYQIDFGQRSVLFWDTLRQSRQSVAGARGRGQAAGARVQVRADRRCAQLRASRELRAGADHPAAWRRDRRRQAAVRHRRSARRPRAGHRRLQGGLRSRRRAEGGPSGLFRHLLSGSRARADARGHHRRGSRVHPHRRRAASATARSRRSSATARAAGR